MIRAEPVVGQYEQGRVHHVGLFPELEDQLCGWDPMGSDPSPDRLDALVWGISELTKNSGPSFSIGPIHDYSATTSFLADLPWAQR